MDEITYDKVENEESPEVKQLYCYNSRLYNDFVNKKVDLNFDGFKYLKEMQE